MRFKPEGLSLNAWAVKAGVSRTVWTDMRRHGNPSRRTLEKLLTAAGSSLLEFEALRLGPEPRQLIPSLASAQVRDAAWGWRSGPPNPLPLVGSRLGGEWGEPGSGVEVTEIRPRELIEHLPRPLVLAGDADSYALTIVGTSMWPRFRTGSRVAISPRSPVAIGDDVLARLAARSERDDLQRVLIMQLVKRMATSFELRQFNPDLTIRIEADEVAAVVKIVGELI